MNNSLYNIPNNWYSNDNEFFNNFVNTNNTYKNNIVDPKEALLRGNLWNDLYDEYKNYGYNKLSATNKYEEGLYNLLKYKFALNELALYLDVNSNDSRMIGLYKDYLQKEKKICDMFVKEFGPITLDDENLGNNSWNWTRSPWPWEGTR